MADRIGLFCSSSVTAGRFSSDWRAPPSHVTAFPWKFCLQLRRPVQGSSDRHPRATSRESGGPIYRAKIRRRVLSAFPLPQWKSGNAPAPCCNLGTDSDTDIRVGGVGDDGELGAGQRTVLRGVLWCVAAGYVVWLFILPYAPGEPVWAITPQTTSMLIDLSLNFFYVLPILNAGGVHVMESPVVHPTAEALFNLVIGWSVLFAPLLFTDRRRDRFQGPLELWWILQMFLTNTFLIPYMAIRLNGPKEPASASPSNRGSGGLLDLKQLSAAMTSGAFTVGAAGAVVGVLTLVWFAVGRAEFGSVADRWNFFLNYVNTDRVAYAFIWDLVLYSIFQPWLIGDNLLNVEKDRADLVRQLRYVPYVGLVAYLWGLSQDTSKD